MVGVHLEGALWLGLLGLLYFFLPAQLVQRWNWEDLLGLSGEWLWLEHLSNLLYALVLVVWGTDLRRLRLQPLSQPTHPP